MLDAPRPKPKSSSRPCGSLLVPSDPNEGRNRHRRDPRRRGREEANLFARDLFEMYRRYAERRDWKLEVLSSDASDRDGLNEITSWCEETMPGGA